MEGYQALLCRYIIFWKNELSETVKAIILLVQNLVIKKTYHQKNITWRDWSGLSKSSIRVTLQA